MRRVAAYIEQILAVVFLGLAVWILLETLTLWSVSGYIEKSRLAFHSGLYSASLTQIDEALSRRETGGLRIMRASAQAAQMEFSAAVKDFRRALRFAPDSTAAKVGLASCLLELADTADGEKRGKLITRARALLEGTAGGDAKVALASIAIQEKDFKKAEHLLLAAEAAGLTMNGLIAYYITRSMVESHLGHHLEALACARKAILIVPKQYGHSPKKSGGIYYRSYRDALRALILAAIRYIETATETSFVKIAAEIERNFGRDAPKHFGVAARFWCDEPETFVVYLALGNTAFRIGRYEDAIKAYKEAWKRCLKKHSDMRRIILLNRALALRHMAKRPGIREGLVRQHLRDAAGFYAQVALDRRASKQLRYWAHLAAAQCLFEIKDYSGARRHAEQAFDLADFRIGLSPTPALLAMAVCADREGKRRKALQLYKRVVVAEDLQNRNDVKRRISQLERRKR